MHGIIPVLKLAFSAGMLAPDHIETTAGAGSMPFHIKILWLKQSKRAL